jgi:hypothetical protein
MFEVNDSYFNELYGTWFQMFGQHYFSISLVNFLELSLHFMILDFSTNKI